jgi:hypothetical protein
VIDHAGPHRSAKLPSCQYLLSGIAPACRRGAGFLLLDEVEGRVTDGLVRLSKGLHLAFSTSLATMISKWTTVPPVRNAE